MLNVHLNNYNLYIGVQHRLSNNFNNPALTNLKWQLSMSYILGSILFKNHITFSILQSWKDLIV